MGLFDGLIGDSLLGADQGSALPISDMDRYKAAISANESGGNYGLTGPVTRTGDRAYGKYQVMGNNVGPWTKEVLGREMTPSEFLNDPQAQERVFEGKFGQLVTKFGNPQDAASAWFSGRPRAQAGNAHDILGTSVPQYVANFNATLGKQPGQSAMPVDTTAAPQPLGAPDPSQLVLPQESLRNLAQAYMTKSLSPVRGLGDALNNFSAMLGGFGATSQYEQQQKAYNQGLGNTLAAAGNDPTKMATALIHSQSLPLMQAGASGIMNRPQVTFKQLGNDIDGTPLIVAEHPNGTMERVDMHSLPAFAQQKIMAGGRMLGPPPANGQPMTSPEATMAGVGSGFVLPQANATAQGGQPAQPKISIADAIRAGVSGEDFKNIVKQNNPLLDAQLRAMTNYDMPIAQFRRAQNNPQLMGMASLYEPNFSASNYEGVQAANKKMAAGPWADTQIAANKAIHHTTQMIQNIPGLNNTSSPLYNRITGEIEGQYNTPYQTALGAFNTNKMGVSAELAKVFKGNGQSAEQEIKNWEHNFSEYGSAPQILSAAKEGMKMLMGQLDPLADKINKERHKNPGDKGYLTGRDLMDSQHQDLFDKIMSIDPQKGAAEVNRVFGKQGAPSGAPATPAAPPNAATAGEPKVLRYNPATGTLE